MQAMKEPGATKADTGSASLLAAFVKAPAIRNKSAHREYSEAGYRLAATTTGPIAAWQPAMAPGRRPADMKINKTPLRGRNRHA